MNRDETTELWLLDFDRCLGSETLYEAARSAISQLPDEILTLLTATQEQVEQEGGSFDVVRYLESNNPGARDEFLRLFRSITDAKNGELYRNKGATALLEQLRSANVPHMIMTYGGVEWQVAKLQAARLLSTPYIVTDSKRKGETIAEWFDADRALFHVTMPKGQKLDFASVCLVDDKAQAFQGLPDQARGYWLRESDELIVSQRGAIPANVTPINSLEEITQRDFATYSTEY